MDGVLLEPADGLESGQKEGEGKRCLERLQPLQPHGMVIGKIASSFYCVHRDARISALAHDLLSDDAIFAVGVINDRNAVEGIIVRRDLLDTLSKPFGRDLFANKLVNRVMSTFAAFDFNANIFSVSDEISEDLYRKSVRYFILTTNRDEFAGIFSTRDMLVFLSQITQADIALAKKIQSVIVKEEYAVNGRHYRIVGASSMAKGVGGDYYTVRTIGDGNLLLVMCDVSGKGISASLISAILGGMIGLYDFSSGVRKFLVKLNEYITSAFEQDRFISGMFIKFNGTTGECTLYDLGHSMAYLYRGEKLMWLGTAEENLPVGVTRELVPRGARFQLQSGDLLLLCTDGLVEQVDDAKEQYGVRRLISVLKRCAGKDPRGIKDELLSDVARHRGTQPQHDDITLLLLEYK